MCNGAVVQWKEYTAAATNSGEKRRHVAGACAGGFWKVEEKVAVALRLARIGEDWSHKASTPFNKNMVGDDGPFHHGPNEPPANNREQQRNIASHTCRFF